MNWEKAYWSNCEGKVASPNSRFFILPFGSKTVQEMRPSLVKLPEAKTIKATCRRYEPDHASWCKSVEKALFLIEKKRATKIVLARKCILDLPYSIDPFAVTAALKKKGSAHHFCFQDGTQAFLGASPERLFIRRNKELESEAVAATYPRGNSPQEDALFEQSLLEGIKERKEFAPIETFLEERLSSFITSPLVFTPLSVLKTPNVQHLYKKCKSTLKDFISDEDLALALHPTPALCGTPQQKALLFLQQLEPFQRGLYTAAFGCKEGESSEWIVAIRCCLLQKTQAILYSGTGIVEGSDPEKEWEELNQKLTLYDGILDH